MQKILSVIIVGTALLMGCTSDYYIKQAIVEYDAVESQIRLGDAKDKVLSILEPTQEHLTENKWRKRPDQYIEDGVLVEIHYFRSALQNDGLTTDDEFTPYVFNDGKLVGIGWAIIGGPKTQGQVTPPPHFNSRYYRSYIYY